MASAAELYVDSMNMKVNELLKEVRIDYSSANTTIVNDFVTEIKQIIHTIPQDFQVTADVAPGFVADIRADKVDFKFKRPKMIEIGGSYAIQCVVKPDVNVDLFIRLPKECFHEKDFLNYRYHAKRFLYLCIIKKYLKRSSMIQDITWSTFQNETRKPVLVVHPVLRLSNKTKFVIRIIPTAASLFSPAKLKMGKNNVRALSQDGVSQPTPKYNSSILEDMFLEDNAEIVKKAFLGWKEIGEALMLLKVWARQRCSIYTHDCMNGFLISVLLTYLAAKSGKNQINNSMNTMQIFRMTLDFIANSKIWDSGLVFPGQVKNHILDKDRRTYFQMFPVVFCDPSTHNNFACRMSKNGFLELREEAALALSCISTYKDGVFDEIFMKKVDFPAKYDYCTRLNLKGNSEVTGSGFCLDDECWRSYEQKVLSLMDQAFTGRAKFVRVLWRNASSSCSLEDGLSMLDGEELLIGISISSVEEAFKQAVVGPSPEEKVKALEFRKFWGDKATLRWFRDSKIAEVAVWEHEDWERHLIVKEIIEHVLSLHLTLPKENIKCFVDQLDFSLLHGSKDPITYSRSLLKAFDDLSKHLRLLSDLPLKISSVQPLDSAFRLTSVYPPEPHPLAYENDKDVKLHNHISTCIQPLEVMIQLEGSGNWPMDEISLEKTKTAFLLQIGESLQNSCGLMCSATENDVDVILSGYAFRLKILHERGLSLVAKKTGSGHVKRVLSADKELFIRGQHSSMINGLRGRYPIYGPVVRLAKRWVSAHLFSTILTEEAIELLVAHLFLKPSPFSAPCSRITGFLRFLRLLSEYDWMFSALIVDINGDLTHTDEKEINENFTSTRKEFEADKRNVNPAMFVATPYDKASEAWTRFSPTYMDLKRLAAYATSSASLLSKLILQIQFDSHKWECLFRTPLNNYDAVVLLHRDRLPYPSNLLFPSDLNQGRLVACGNATKIFDPIVSVKNFKGSIEELKSRLMVDFDPLKCYIADIQNEFPDMFKLWYDVLGGDALGLTWEKTSSKKRGRDLSEDDQKNMIDTLQAVGKVGRGFVRSVHYLKAPRLTS
ncbi:RNA metabolism protein [Lithospermum erythrorhizon]|uniref:RNA metabolism protein n=1 Tax=Lithospermum erythrorhizon TaxID=34254 RepID=A0AAV3RKJ4_LITER